MDNINEEEIKKLIKEGFDLELISFELEIPMEILKKCKYQIMGTTQNKNIIKRDNSKIGKLRDRYYELYYVGKRPSLEKKEIITDEQVELINKAITTIETKINTISEVPKSEKRSCVADILKEIKKIEELQLTIEQAEKLLILMKNKELESINFKKGDTIINYINRAKTEILVNLMKAIDIEQSQTNSINELKRLQSKITVEMERQKPNIVASVRIKIFNKIVEIQKKEAVKRIKYDISNDIKKIIVDLSKGELDIQEANETINKEVHKNIEHQTVTRFSLTEEQQKKQIMIQIRTALKEDELYDIEYPEKTIQQLYELTGETLESAVGIVVEKYIMKKNFERAKKLCNQYKSSDVESQITKYMHKLKKQIRSAEIGDLVLKIINLKMEPEAEERYYNLIERWIREKNIKLGSVSLGKNESGTKTITLADIWEPEKTR